MSFSLNCFSGCKAGRPRIINIKSRTTYQNIYSWGRNLFRQVNYIPNLYCQWRVNWNPAKFVGIHYTFFISFLFYL
jgi:hypothetical protein